MFKGIKAALARTLDEESLSDRTRRMVPGALYAALAAAVYVTTFSTINIILFPALQISMDWARFFGYLFGFGIGLALSGAIVGWFTEDYMGVIGGGVIMTALLLIGNLVVSSVNGGGASLTVQSFVTSLPLVGAAILLAFGIRMAIKRHVNNSQEAPEIRRKLLAGLVLIVFLVGLTPGIFSIYDLSTQSAIHTLNDSLQANTSDSSAMGRFRFDNTPSWKAHFGMKYALYPRNSVVAAGAMDITIRYEDGYAVTCVVDTTGGDQTYFTDCIEGTKFTSP